MIRAPEKIPAPPRPATVRPAMNMDEEFAAAQITDPTSKIKMAARNIHFTEKMLYSFPKGS
jgi:hypothetical protein